MWTWIRLICGYAWIEDTAGHGFCIEIYLRLTKSYCSILWLVILEMCSIGFYRSVRVALLLNINQPKWLNLPRLQEHRWNLLHKFFFSGKGNASSPVEVMFGWIFVPTFSLRIGIMFSLWIGTMFKFWIRNIVFSLGIGNIVQSSKSWQHFSVCKLVTMFSW